ncbi:hypothetical protein Y032_0059g2964 [Ancylostoma ceylanicum]|uniref:Uncharacterized protein n=1 Tax=Ancylostoma ceylanicum TaxID=53326 RepID=A0A016U2W5_9BILA|nr:hypothetical protein Y032_0059g2964 [Ancylostoma ceylanicum]
MIKNRASRIAAAAQTHALSVPHDIRGGRAEFTQHRVRKSSPSTQRLACEVFLERKRTQCDVTIKAWEFFQPTPVTAYIQEYKIPEASFSPRLVLQWQLTNPDRLRSRTTS